MSLTVHNEIVGEFSAWGHTGTHGSHAASLAVESFRTEAEAPKVKLDERSATLKPTDAA